MALGRKGFTIPESVLVETGDIVKGGWGGEGEVFQLQIELNAS